MTAENQLPDAVKNDAPPDRCCGICQFWKDLTLSRPPPGPASVGECNEWWRFTEDNQGCDRWKMRRPSRPRA